MVKLKRLKWIFNPTEHLGLGFTHAQVPTPLVMKDRLRIFISGRVNNISHIYSIDIEPPPSFKVIEVNRTPVLKPNTNMGTFDDEGVMPSCIFEFQPGQFYMFYSGWNSRNTIPYHNATGIAQYDISQNKVNRIFQGPLLERTLSHPYLAVTPFVWKEDDGYSALYISGIGWEMGNGKYEPIYVIKYASSKDLLSWDRPNDQYIPSVGGVECFSNPTVRKNSRGALDILFCSRKPFDFRSNIKNSYKIGYAKNEGGLIDRQPIEWIGDEKKDIEDVMQCYPSFFSWGGKEYVLYNGNHFGLTGFGVAEFLEQ